MAKARITFDLENEDDIRKFEQFNRLYKTDAVLFEIAFNLKKRCNWFLDANPGTDASEYIFEQIAELFEQHNLYRDELV